jgi:hypothetical protein
MNAPWYLRTYLEQVQRLAGLVVPPAQQEHFARTDFDIDELPIPAKSFKASKIPRDPASLTHIIVHVTAVRGGFGLAASAHRRWRQHIEAHDIPGVILHDLFASGDMMDVDIPQPVDPDRLARRLGLWERYRNTPYHEIASQTGDCVANRRLEQRSHHAGDLNAFSAGFAMDCAPDEPMSSDFVATCRHGLLCLAHRMANKDAETPIKVGPHRSGSSQRRNDTARTAWLAVIKPTCQEHPDLLAIDYHLRVGSGLPVSRSWDPDALYDDRGRKL